MNNLQKNIFLLTIFVVVINTYIYSEGGDPPYSDPQGPLAGKHIILSAGHGLRYNDSFSAWVYERAWITSKEGVLYLEDWGNAYRTRILRNYLIYHGGATCHSVRETKIDDSIIFTETWPGSINPNTPRWRMSPRYYMRLDPYNENVPSSVYDTSLVTGESSKNLRSRVYYCNWYLRNFSPSKADIYISLHSNAVSGASTVRGTEVLYANDTTTSYTDYDNTDYTVPSSVRTQSYNLATKIDNKIIQTMRAFYDSAWVDRGLKLYNDYTEPSRPRVPGCLIEYAFHTATGPPTTADFTALTTEQGMRLLSQATYKGICDFYGVDYNLPARITDLQAESTANTGEVKLSWTAPGEVSGKTTCFLLLSVSSYTVKYATFVITSANWDSATLYPQTWSPSSPGKKETKYLSNFSLGVTYYFAIRSINDTKDNSRISNVASVYLSVAAPPPAPTNLTALYSESGYGCVLSWSNVSGATAYDVCYRPTGGSWVYYYDITSPNFGNISWPGFYIVPGNAGSYDFGVRSKNAAGTSAWTYIYSVSIPNYTRPSKPTNVSCIVLSSVSIQLSWSSVSGAVGYTIFRSTSSTMLENLCKNILPTGTTNWSNLTLATDGSRDSSSAASSLANMVSYVKVGFTQPLPVHIFYFKLKDTDNRIYKKVKPRYYNSSDTIVELENDYRAYRSEFVYRLSSSADVLCKGVGLVFDTNQGNTTNLYNDICEIEAYGGYLTKTTQTSYVDINLLPDTVYYYRINAYRTENNKDVISDMSVTVTTRTLPIPGVAPNPPSNLQSVVLSSTSVKLTWQDNSSNESGFKIERKLAGGSYSVVATLGSNVVTYTDNGLQPATTYYYRVCSYNSYGNSSYSNEVVAVTLVVADTTPPQNPTWSKCWDSSVKNIEFTSGVWQRYDKRPYFEWGGASDTGSGVYGYSVYWGSDPNGEPGTTVVVLDSGGIGKYDVPTDAVSDVKYYLRVRTRDNAGNWSSAVTLFEFCFDNVVPVVSNIVQNNYVISPANNDGYKDSVSVSYNLSEGSSVTVKIMTQAGSVVRVILNNVWQQQGSNSFVWDGKDGAGNYVSDSSYTYKIELVDKAGNVGTPFSGVVRIDNSMPTEVVDLIVDNIGGGDIGLTWGGATDDSGIWYYEISRNNVKITTTTELSYIDSGSNLVDGVTYYYKVVSVDTVGNKSEGVEVSVVCNKSGVSVTEFNLSNNGYISPNNDGVYDNVNIDYKLSGNAVVTVYIKDISGAQIVKKLEENMTKIGGVKYTVVWDGTMEDGSVVNDGVYTLELIVNDGSHVYTRKKSLYVDTVVDVTNLVVNPSIFSPNNDGYEDQTLISYALGEDAYVTITIIDNQNNLVNTIQNNVFRSAGQRSVYWNGKDSNNIDVSDGKYKVKLSVTDVAGNTSTIETYVEIDKYFGKVVGYIYEDNGLGNIPGNRISGVLCSIEELGYTTMSDETGYFSIAKIPPENNYTLKVSKVGYVTVRTKVYVSAGSVRWNSVALARGYDVYSSTVSPPVIEHKPVNVVGVRNDIIKLYTSVSDENGVKDVKIRYRIKSNGVWYDWVEKTMVQSSENLFYVTLSDEITNNDNIEAVEYMITSDNNLGLFSTTEVFYVEFKNEVEGMLGKMGGSVVLPDGNPDDGECKVEVVKGMLSNNVKIKMSQLSRSSVVSHQQRSLVYNQLKPVMVYKVESDPSLVEVKGGIVLKLLYLDVDNDGKEDISGVDETKLRVWWLDEKSNEWRYVGGEVDRVRNVISVKVNHLSVYGIYPTVGVDGDMFRPKEKIIMVSKSVGGTTSGGSVKGAIFSGIQNAGVVVRIYDVKGRKVRELVGTDIWDAKDDNGNEVDSGLYIYQYEFEGKKYQGTIVVGR
jgi:flagellar hook assembly protein FlgD